MRRMSIFLPTFANLRNKSRSTAGVCFSAMALLIYVCTVFALPQEREHGFLSERGSLAIAISNVAYGAPFATYYSGVLNALPDGVDKSLRQALDNLPRDRQPGALQNATNDGIGVGYALLATVALRLFGVHAWALPLFTVVLMGLSAQMLLWRFGAAIAGIVILYFCALTVMLFTGIVWDPNCSVGIPVGGIRYFSLVGILPAFHLLFEVLDDPSGEIPTGKSGYFLLGLQMVILVLVSLARASAGPLIGAVGLVSLWVAWRNRGHRERFRTVVRKTAVMALVGVGVLGAVMLASPDDARNGRVTSVFWHRAVISLAYNPEWFFVVFPQMFDCSRYMPGFNAGDRIGICIWVDHAIKTNMPESEIADGLYGGRYENVMRQAFIDIAFRFPREVLSTFLYYKMKFIPSSLGANLQMNISAYPPLAIGLIVAALANLLVYAVGFGGLYSRWLMAGAVLLFAASTIPPYLVAWAAPYTTADLLFYCIFGAGLALSEAAGAARMMFRRASSPDLIPGRSRPRDDQHHDADQERSRPQGPDLGPLRTDPGTDQAAQGHEPRAHQSGHR
jgi:hypothetical protein